MMVMRRIKISIRIRIRIKLRRDQEQEAEEDDATDYDDALLEKPTTIGTRTIREARYDRSL